MWIALLLTAWAAPTPVIELSTGLHHHRTTAAERGAEIGSDRTPTLALGAALGVAYETPLTLGAKPLLGVSTLGAAVDSWRGQAQLCAAQELWWTAGAWGPWRARVGAALAVEIGEDAALAPGLRAALALGPLELVWMPALRVPLTSDARTSFGAVVTAGPAVEVAPLAVALRATIDAW